MVQYRLIPEWFVAVDNQPFKIISIDTTNLLNYESDIKELIIYFNMRYDWDKFPTWDIVVDRVNSNKNLFFLCEYNDKIIGWGWWRIGEVDINKSHIKFYTITNETTAWGYNLFLASSKIIKKPKNSGTLWCNAMFNKLFELGITEIISDIENWQSISYKMFEENNMKKENWLLTFFENA